MRPHTSRTPAGFGSEPTAVARAPASAYLVLNSRDRFNNSTPGQTTPVLQPWNDFRLQKPSPLMESFARRIDVTEVRFPWYIANINGQNNYFIMILNTEPELTVLKVVIPPGFNTPTQIAQAMQLSINKEAGDAGLGPGQIPVVTYEGNQFIFDSSGATFTFAQPIRNPNIAGYALMTPQQYQTQPSLLRTIGMPPEFMTFTKTDITTFYKPVFTNYSTCLYTDYVDIVSNKLNYYSNVRDGSSGGQTQSSLICRLYCADEVSLASTAPIGCAPFIIHRQFKTPKSVQWDPDSMIDWLDVSVYDQYGNLVDIGNPSGIQQGPDFQITLMASES